MLASMLLIVAVTTLQASVTTLQSVSFKRSSAIGNIAPLAKLTELRLVDVTECPRVTDRRAFTANAAIKILPEH